MKYNPMLLCDFYKVVHSDQYPKGITRVVSYFTPRMNRLKMIDKLVMFGLQGFIKEYLIDYFNENFFSKPCYVVAEEYERVLNYTLGKGTFNSQKIRDLHKLGYLPIKISTLPEGTKVPVGVPMFEITNTHPEFAWLVNSLETLISCSLWHPMLCASVGAKYREIVDKYYDKTVVGFPKRRALGDFSMRGQECKESAIKSSAGFCLSFVNTATVSTIPYLEYYYNCDCTKEEVAFGAISTEHSVMNTNFAIDGDEISMVKRLLTEIYPNNNFSMVSDSYDYWNLVDNILPQCKEEIMNHNGIMLVRGDSGDPIEIVTETVFKLWETFGGAVNEKGYKVLSPKIRAIYGDSITIQRAEQVYEILEENGFAANNVILGVGSFSMQCLEEEGTFKPFTRDTFGIAIKATYCEVDGKEIPIYKDPKTDDSKFKKSQKGCCAVFENNGELSYKDGYSYAEVSGLEDNKLVEIFLDGKLTKECTLKEIRDILHSDFNS